MLTEKKAIERDVVEMMCTELLVPQEHLLRKIDAAANDQAAESKSFRAEETGHAQRSNIYTLLRFYILIQDNACFPFICML